MASFLISLLHCFDVRYPTLRFYDGDFRQDYKGVRAFTAIETFLERALQPPYTEISSIDELRLLQSEHPVIFLYFQTDSQSVVDPNAKVIYKCRCVSSAVCAFEVEHALFFLLAS
jgi:hypothetical protein